jgi:IS5 family transposase
MGFKNMDREISFADLILKDSMYKNRCLNRLSYISGSIDWDRINSVLMNHYRVGTSREGADAYPPLILFKCMLLQKWFHPRGIGFAFHRASIDSDPELENQIYPVK